jgi:hypothetical protein
VLRRAEDGIVAEIGAGTGPVRALHAVYDTEHTTPIASGENEGQRLREYRIVRRAELLGEWDGEWDGSARRFTVTAPDPAQGQVVLVQSADLRVIGAADQPPA